MYSLGLYTVNHKNPRDHEKISRLTDGANVSVLLVAGEVLSVTQLNDVVYIVCRWCPAVLTFSLTTHRRLEDVFILGWPVDVAACESTSMLYIAACDRRCVWRRSEDGEEVNVHCKLPAVLANIFDLSAADFFVPYSLSVTSTGLLVMLRNTRQLIEYDADGCEFIHVQLPDDMEPRYAVLSPTGTFLISLYHWSLKRWQVVEVDTGGEVLRQFSGSRQPSLCSLTPHVAVDSHGNIFVADRDNGRILLLDDHLSLRRVIIDEHQLNNEHPWRLCYVEESGQLLVGLDNNVAVFDVLCC